MCCLVAQVDCPDFNIYYQKKKKKKKKKERKEMALGMQRKQMAEVTLS
jgi:hypothetical protein